MIERPGRQDTHPLRRLFAFAILLAVSSAFAQTASAAASLQSAPAFTFDVVSIKPDQSANNNIRIMARSNVYSATNITLEILLQGAYGLKMPGLVSGLPKWAQNAHYDVDAKIDEATAAAIKDLPADQKDSARQAMMQALLADRFHLKAHRVTRDLPVYAMVVAKSGFKLQPADPGNTYPNGMKTPDGKPGIGFTSMGRGTLNAQAIPLENLARMLTGDAHRLIIDRTGLTGKYDISLQWTPDDGPPPSTDSTAPPLFTALQEQVGLRLEPQKAPVETLVVDQLDQPSEN